MLLAKEPYLSADTYQCPDCQPDGIILILIELIELISATELNALCISFGQAYIDHMSSHREYGQYSDSQLRCIFIQGGDHAALFVQVIDLIFPKAQTFIWLKGTEPIIDLCQAATITSQAHHQFPKSKVREQCQKELKEAEKEAEKQKAKWGEDDRDYKKEMEKIENAQKKMKEKMKK